ncbi:winged helix DNA-binding domain-containing protein [Saccharothrix coeruleofusca]|uniref:Winged helix DNA-binding protein n=1 Tax=Saccharothrix coeruleofusca TaxID=33919 RepID=A0A918EG77_9PSEU|nr:winged helix DNA-binding domain-containing protein [Saccharothrix coeruleofusca]MBP2336645.1 hypothetical protein [Saccharothrix coeruleofusca]GGP78995.1 hypothetical protein GCM10010185_61120 [Saccharothrix coeruleofusca]
MRRFDIAERRARLGHRHRLAAEARAADPTEVAESVVALHSTDPTSVYLSALTRMREGGLGDVERALYEDRSLIRMLAMRRTVFVTTVRTASVVHAACGRAVAARERRKLLSMLAETGVGDDVEGWLADVEETALRALARRGEATAAELATDDERLRQQVVLAKGKHYEGKQNVASRVLLLLAAEGRVVRGRPRGSWTSHQYKWSPLSRWTPDGLADWPTAQAEVELARRWLAAYGPAFPEDLQWWTGWTKTQVKRALAELRPVEVDLDGRPGVVLADDLEPTPAPEPWVALLPALDPTPMGWQQRDWFLGGHGPKLFDRVGNIGPSLWWDGRVVGGWAQDAGGQVVCRFLEDVGSDARAAAERAAASLTELLGDVVLSARTRGKTWLEEELSAK